MVRQLYLYSIEAADFPDSVTSENTLREFPLVIATVAKVSRKHGLWLVVRVNKQLRSTRNTDCRSCLYLFSAGPQSYLLFALLQQSLSVSFFGQIFSYRSTSTTKIVAPPTSTDIGIVAQWTMEEPDTYGILIVIFW